MKIFHTAKQISQKGKMRVLYKHFQDADKLSQTCSARILLIKQKHLLTR